ncbi:MAG TPA: penicillin-binding protein 2 [Allosphingosinicella sp.]|jgi:cell division protein FtsI (penicillin-binding protein 3)
MTAYAAIAPRTATPAPRPEGLALTYHRLMLIMLVFAGVTMLIATRLLWLQVSTDRSTGDAGLNPLIPARGDIVDRNGVALARSIDAWTIAIHPDRLLGNPEELALKLAQLIPEHSADDYRKLLKSKKSFAYLSHRALPELVSAVNALGEPAIEFSREPERLYPQTGLAAHVLGWTSTEGHGVSGMEKVLDARLTGPQRGAPVELSIDTRVQATMESELAAAMAKFSAIGAAGVVLDLKTGEVLAMTSLPQLNPNRPGQGAVDAGFNRATLGVYELGSTFKPFTVAMAMDSGIIKSFSQMYNCPTGLPVAGGHVITDTHPFGGPCSVADIMRESSNIGTAQIAAQVGSQRQQDFLRRMGFLEPVQVELHERGRTLTPGNNWGEVATMTVGFGHGIAVTPLHLALGYATLFNGGIRRPATLYKVGPGHPVPEGTRVFTEETSRRMRGLLRLVVLAGTGKKADAPGFRVGGKTGTAEKLQGGHYSGSAVVTTFAGVFPMDEPRYVVVAMLDDPKATPDTFGFHTAGWNVAPVVSRVVSRVGALLGVAPDPSREADLTEVAAYLKPEAKH